MPFLKNYTYYFKKMEELNFLSWKIIRVLDGLLIMTVGKLGRTASDLSS